MKGGIDYGRGLSNIDRETGIRFGIVSANEMGEGFWDDVESEYDPSCPKCGGDLTEDQVSDLDANAKPHESKYIKGYFKHMAPCPHCEELISVDDITPEEPSRNVIKSDGIEGFVDSHNDVWITKSPFYTYGTFCSPCAPGACSIGTKYNDSDTDLPRAYCLPYSWYDERTPIKPGTVFRVKDDSVVQPEDDDA